MSFEKPSIQTKEKKEQPLSAEEIREKLRTDPSYLPSFREIMRHVDRIDFNPTRRSDERDKWRDLCSNGEKHMHEIWTKEYIQAFGKYLTKRIGELGGTEQNPIMILEVGAGNGRLSHFLNEKLNEMAPGKFKVVATDSGKKNISLDFPVEKLTSKKALGKYSPQIVICSWMTGTTDLSADFRAQPSVDEYILIGEPDTEACGKAWETWGDKRGLSAKMQKKLKDEKPPYEADGFERKSLHDLNTVQLSRMKFWGFMGMDTSRTVSFLKKE